MNELFRLTFNIGVIARGLLVLVKPMALWASIQFDTDNGIQLAQIFLVGLLIVSISATNAHKNFYKIIFNEKFKNQKIKISRSYIGYLSQISSQLFLVILFAIVFSIIVFENYEIILLGLVFGFSEKINDEYQRFAQFENNNIKLMALALTKHFAFIASLGFVWFDISEIRFLFPFLFLFLTLILNINTLKTCLSCIFYEIQNSVLSFLMKGFRHIRDDFSQISWVFFGMGFLSIDKWLVQFFSIDYLPQYMLISQLSSALLVIQYTFFIAPYRIKLLSHHPNKIKLIYWGTIILSITSILISIGIFLWDDNNIEDKILFFPFLLAPLFMFYAPLGERFFWISEGKNRMLTDLVVVCTYSSALLVLNYYLSREYLLFGSLVLLTIILIFRVLLVFNIANIYEDQK